MLHIRQARCQLAFVDSEVASTDSPSPSEIDSESSFKEGTIYSSVDTFDASSTDTNVEDMVVPRRITLKEAGAP
ncbi:hypothetical protein AHAS_Ahas01G0152900 [Arachis hypogaea]